MEQTTPPALRRRLRSAGAIFSGVAVIVVLSIATDWVMHTTGVFPPEGRPMAAGLWLLALEYRFFYGVLGSWLAARLAPDRPMWHAMALGVMGLVVSTLGAVATWNAGPGFGPRWYPLALIATVLPCSWIGGMIYIKRFAGAPRK